jgi:tetratricopeptide (TPR) repeat protein
MGREQEALEAFRQLNDGAEYVRMAGERARAARDWGAAITLYELSMSIAPTRDAAQALLDLYLRTENDQAVAEVWRRLATATPQSDPQHWWAQGALAEWNEEWDSAAKAFERGAELSDTPCDFFRRQVSNLERLQEWDEAEGACLQALDVCPDRRWPYLQLGSLRSQQDDDVGALQWYRRAELLWPESLEPKYHMGVIYFGQEDYGQAQALLQQALALDARHHWSAYFLAWCFHESGDQARAISTLSRAIELSGSEPWRWAMLLGDWQVERQAWEQAIAAYQQALQWRPGEEAVQRRLDRAVERSR